MKLKRIATITEDFAYGHEQMGGFQRVFEDNGGHIVKKLWPPIATPDYTPYLAQIGDVDGVCQGFAGSNPLRFKQQYAERRARNIPVVTAKPAATTRCCKSFGDEAIGVISRVPYTLDFDTKATSASSTEMLKDRRRPGVYAAGIYVNGRCIEGGLKTRRQGRRQDS